MGMSKILLTFVMVMAATVGLAAEGRFKIAYATYLGGRHWEEAREIIATRTRFEKEHHYGTTRFREAGAGCTRRDRSKA